MADCTYTFKTAEGEVTIKGMAEMKAFLALNGVGAIDGAKAPMFSQRAFHGTPHRGINKFSTDKIGTGEGAQAYGWGLYFADKREIAEHYRKVLQGGPLGLKVQEAATRALGVEYDEAASSSQFIDGVRNVAGNGEDAVREAIIKTADRMSRSQWPGDKRLAERVRALADNTAVVKAVNKEAAGQLYEVEIPEDSEMLLWDKPLSEQSEAVRAAVDKLFENGALDDGSKKLIESQGMRQDLKGKTLYELLATSDNLAIDGTGRAASLALAEAGIKGIKYLDGTSRDAGGGSYNYVVFSGDDVAIQQAFYSKRAKQSWFLGRDDLGNFTFGAGAKAYRYAADMANLVLDKMALKPISTDLSRAMRKMKMEISKAQELTVDVATKLQELPQQEREMISDVIEGELKRGAKPPKRVLELAASMQAIMSEQTAELVRLGMLTKDAAGRWDGKYLPRFYESKLKSEANGWVKAAKALLGRKKTMQGIGGSSLKGRGLFQTIPVEDLEAWLAEGWEERDPDFDPDTDTEITVWRDYTRQERDDMGEIRDSMFRFVMGYSKSQRDISLGRLYENIASTVASKKEKPGFVQVPRTNIEDTYAKRYGKLAGMWVPQEVLDHLTAFDDSMQSEVLKMYLKGMSMWKEGKTVLNPVSHANNIMSNVTMAHFAGVSYWDAHKYVATTRDIMKNAPMLQEAKDAGLWLGTMTQAEMTDLLPDQLKVLAAKTESKSGQAVEGVWNALSFWLRKPMGKAYEAEDLFFRYLIYRDARTKGLTPDESVDYAQKFIFTYDDLPKNARRIRDFALPFFAYTYKAIPAMAETALTHPWRYAAPAAALYTINAAMYAIAAGAGEDEEWWELIKRRFTDEDFAAQAKALEADERKNLPEWMKGASLTLGTYKSIRLGMDEATNLPVFLDVSRIFPGGDLFDAVNNAGGVPLIAPLTPNNPILTTAYAMLANKDTFRGKDIVTPADTDAEAAAKRADWAWKQFTPAVAVGNAHFERAMNVIANQMGKPLDLGIAEYTGVDKQGQPVSLAYSAMQTVGIKARPIDLELSEKIRQSQENKLIRDIEASMRSIRRLEQKGAISSENAERQIELQQEKRDRLRAGLTVEGEERD
jgi:hypothetical protein